MTDSERNHSLGNAQLEGMFRCSGRRSPVQATRVERRDERVRCRAQWHRGFRCEVKAMDSLNARAGAEATNSPRRDNQRENSLVQIDAP